MVRIDRIVMKGFKSFANRTVVPFPEGFNAICGPNGSGKSNILDAMVFVLGVRSARSIRAGKLEDLVFKGGDGRDASEYASVSLYLDNTDGEIPGQDEEVKVTRKVKSSGGSVYKLNGETVTRRKIIDVLANGRIYADGHNIIFQGDITNLIEMSPRERRTIIDEISGIAEFDEKREKAERELEKVEEKLKEARIRLNERENNLEKLEEEMELAQKYRELENDLEKLRASIVKKQMDSFEEKLEKKRAEIEERRADLEEAEKEKEEIDEELNELQKKERVAALSVQSEDTELAERISDLRTKIERKMTQIESYEREIERLEDVIGTLSDKNAAAKEVVALGKDGVHGTIGDLLTVPAEYGTAIEVAAGGRINNLVVETDELAQECIEHLKKKEIGRATFLPLNKLNVRSRSREAKQLIGQDGVVDFAINLIDYDSRYDPAFRQVFRDTVVVEDMETAREHMGKARMVTLEGDIVRKSGAMTGGFRRKKDTPDYGKQKEDLEKKIDGLEKEIEELQEELKEAKEEKQEEEEERREMEEEMGDTLDRIEELRAEREKKVEEEMSIQNDISNLKVKKAKYEGEMESLEKEKESYEEYFEKEDFYTENLDTLKQKKKEILEEMNKIGTVNFKAIENYEAMKRLYEDLKEKVDKIEEEKQAVLDMAESIEKKRKQAFMETFEEIDENFSQIFRDIEGGEAELELEEEGNINSGLVIKARPEGKEELHLDAMSGGEKTLTAMAFMFAVQMHKPAPFYMMDEIDAALDKKNSKKVAQLLKKYSDDAQFILITHNDTTISMADRVYGVSMEDGVSKIVSMELPEN